VSAPALELHGVTVRFGGIVAADAVSFTVAPGETVGLIGPNGAGKTTILDVVAGARRPAEGRVSLYGDQVTTRSVVQRARAGVARTFQQLSLFEDMTVRDHVVLGCLAARTAAGDAPGYWRGRASVERALLADDSPLGPVALLRRLRLEPLADEPASAQSVGTVRMIDLARALASRPRLLLLDEPVSGLNEAEAQHVAEVLVSLHADHDLAMLVVEHNLEFARLLSDRIVALDFGKVIADGAPADVLGSTALREAYFGAAAA